MVKVEVEADFETFSKISGDVVIELDPIDAASADYDARKLKIVCVSDGRVLARLCMDAINSFKFGQSVIEGSQQLARHMSPEALREYEIALFACMGQRAD